MAAMDAITTRPQTAEIPNITCAVLSDKLLVSYAKPGQILAYIWAVSANPKTHSDEAAEAMPQLG
ncbi:hypothetical protein RUM8411_02039 [Ruegeria meonggei]|uniref:Uncharacterized protein n=1 Tax=Ruegeria meonggei TaxID=1446476 RepID=A0A1X6Z901_9RHOB|nr:hypothetical protein RUM8411_02039 [Ruegeria meonggei]